MMHVDWRIAGIIAPHVETLLYTELAQRDANYVHSGVSTSGILNPSCAFQRASCGPCSETICKPCRWLFSAGTNGMAF